MNVNLLPANILKWMVKEDRDKYAKGQLTADEALDRFAKREERNLHKLFINWLLLHDLDYDHSRMDKPATIKKGRADFHVWKAILHCFVEFKTEHGRLSPEQIAFVTRQREKHTPILVTTSFLEATQFVSRVLELEPLGS
jgi:hypothetical protein